MHRHRDLAGQVRREGGTPQKLEDSTRPLYKEREELGKLYIEMLRALLSDKDFLELDGARRWIPRSEQQLENLSYPSSSGDHELKMKSGKAAEQKRAKEEKENNSKPDRSGTSNKEKDSGMRGPGS
jgi:hypothetical protein